MAEFFLRDSFGDTYGGIVRSTWTNNRRTNDLTVRRIVIPKWHATKIDLWHATKIDLLNKFILVSYKNVVYHIFFSSQ